MSNWKRFTIGNTTINARSIKEASEKLCEMATKKTASIEESNALSNGWKIFIYNGWFKVKARNLNEAQKNAENKLLVLTEKDFSISDSDGTEIPAPVNSVATVVPPAKRKPAVVSLQQRPEVGHNLYIIGNGDNEGGRFAAIAADTPEEAWNEAVKQHSQVQLSGCNRLGMWQRVIVPMSVSKGWKAIDFTKSIDTPTHFYTDIPIYLGLSDEPFNGRQTLNVDANSIFDGVVKSETETDRIVLPGKLILIGKEDKVENVNQSSGSFARNDFAMTE